MRQKQTLPKALRRRVHLDEATAAGLRGAFALPADDGELRAYVDRHWHQWLADFDKSFRIASDPSDVWQARCKAFVEARFGVSRESADWWRKLLFFLATEHSQAFSIKPSRRRLGRSPKWTNKQSCELFADVQFQKRQSELSERSICAVLPKHRRYKARWGAYKGPTLLKAYRNAKKRRRTDHIFEAELCGPDGLRSRDAGARIASAIKRHAIR